MPRTPRCVKKFDIISNMDGMKFDNICNMDWKTYDIISNMDGKKYDIIIAIWMDEWTYLHFGLWVIQPF